MFYEFEEKSEVITENNKIENSVLSEYITETTLDLPDSSELNIPEFSESKSIESDNDIILESGSYTTPEDVAEYIHTFGTLPENFITKREAQDLGWVSSEGNLWDVAYGMSIGGDRFGNYEKLLPDADGRNWTECDVNYTGGFRGSERIIFSNDGLIFYTSDHYESFEQIY
ncbi:MAG: ribonuclease [Oscillospiraceae bacterium]|nr:ribonuclease [Oscillospiraceae bacterium]